jgi:hypothetical protein
MFRDQAKAYYKGRAGVRRQLCRGRIWMAPGRPAAPRRSEGYCPGRGLGSVSPAGTGGSHQPCGVRRSRRSRRRGGRVAGIFGGGEAAAVAADDPGGAVVVVHGQDSPGTLPGYRRSGRSCEAAVPVGMSGHQVASRGSDVETERGGMPCRAVGFQTGSTRGASPPWGWAWALAPWPISPRSLAGGRCLGNDPQRQEPSWLHLPYPATRSSVRAAPAARPAGPRGGGSKCP